MENGRQLFKKNWIFYVNQKKPDFMKQKSE